MKKTGILLAILLIAGVCAMADDAVPAAQGAVLFADIDAVALSQAEMAVVDGGQFPGDYGETKAGLKAAIRMRSRDADRYEGHMKMYGAATDVAGIIPGAWRLSGGRNGTQAKYFEAP